MTTFVFDTDTFSLYRRGNPDLLRRLKVLGGDTVCVSVFTVEEALSGWYGLLRRAKNDTELLTVYRRLEETIPVLARFPLLTLSASALDEYNRLRALKLNIGPMDLRIAGIVLANDATLVTRNRRDFSRVPGLQFEDWTEIV